jgi:nitrite reductase (NADH) small subunit
MIMQSTDTQTHWITLCQLEDLDPNAGVCALFGDEPIALFFLPNETEQVFALDNRDPFGKRASVLSRGILADINGRWTVASPLYKQHFCLRTGTCLEDAEKSVRVWTVKLKGHNVMLQVA